MGIDCRDLLPGAQSGIGRFVENLLRAASLEDNPPPFFLYGNQNTEFPLDAAWGQPVRAETRWKLEGWTWWWDRFTLPAMARRDKLDVFLSPYYKAPAIRACPVAVTIHDLIFLRLPPALSGRGKLYCRLFRTRARRFAHNAAAVLTVSDHARRDIVELLDVPEKKVHVVGHCVGPQYLRVENPQMLDAVKQVYGIEGEYLLYVGNFSRHKNVDGLLRTYARLDPTLQQRVRLVLAGGEGPGLRRVRSVVRRLRLDHAVRITGHVEEEHLPALYSAAAAFVTLTHWEGFGLPVLEAMACGTPVLCSKRAALPEVVGDGAVVVDPDDHDACLSALTSILTNDSLRAEMRVRGPARANDFAPRRFARRTLAALEKAVAGP